MCGMVATRREPDMNLDPEPSLAGDLDFEQPVAVLTEDMMLSKAAAGYGAEAVGCLQVRLLLAGGSCSAVAVVSLGLGNREGCA